MLLKISNSKNSAESLFTPRAFPAICHPEASHGKLRSISILLSRAEGSAPLHLRAIQNCLDDRVVQFDSFRSFKPFTKRHPDGR